MCHPGAHLHSLRVCVPVCACVKGGLPCLLLTAIHLPAGRLVDALKNYEIIFYLAGSRWPWRIFMAVATTVACAGPVTPTQPRHRGRPAMRRRLRPAGL